MQFRCASEPQALAASARLRDRLRDPRIRIVVIHPTPARPHWLLTVSVGRAA